jgi:hypothetical protein
MLEQVIVLEPLDLQVIFTVIVFMNVK